MATRPNHWQHDAGGFYCELDPDKSRQSPMQECRFCRQAEKDRLKELESTLNMVQVTLAHLIQDEEVFPGIGETSAKNALKEVNKVLGISDEE